MRIFVIAAFSVLMATGSPAQSLSAAQAEPPPIFRIATDEFWLNLHHFLYLLGRAEAKTSDSTREAVAEAPREAERGMKTLTDEERKVWAGAVTAYATGLSLKDAVREAPMPAVTAALAEAGDTQTLTNTAIESAVRDVLERAAPIYRKTWWPAHLAANRAWRSSIEALVISHGQTILGFLTRSYNMEWPPAGYAVHASGYSTFGGATPQYEACSSFPRWPRRVRDCRGSRRSFTKACTSGITRSIRRSGLRPGRSKRLFLLIFRTRSSGSLPERLFDEWILPTSRT